MRFFAPLLALGLAACATNTNSAPTGATGMATSGAGLQVGASAGSSIGGGPLGAGTDDNRAGAK